MACIEDHVSGNSYIYHEQAASPLSSTLQLLEKDEQLGIAVEIGPIEVEEFWCGEGEDDEPELENCDGPKIIVLVVKKNVE